MLPSKKSSRQLTTYRYNYNCRAGFGLCRCDRRKDRFNRQSARASAEAAHLPRHEAAQPCQSKRADARSSGALALLLWQSFPLGEPTAVSAQPNCLSGSYALKKRMRIPFPVAQSLKTFSPNCFASSLKCSLPISIISFIFLPMSIGTPSISTIIAVFSVRSSSS